MTTIEHGLAVLALLTLLSCGSDEITGGALTGKDDTTELSPPEVFTWSDCAIEFSPPPTEWKRQRLQGPLEGVSFRIARVPPGFIDVAYYRSLHRSHTVQSLASGREQSFEPPAPGFTLDDVIDRVLFDPETLPNPDRVDVQPEVERLVDGLDALGLDYTWADTKHTFHGREVYVVARESLFVARMRGNEADLDLFERVVETIRFHPDEE